MARRRSHGDVAMISLHDASSGMHPASSPLLRKVHMDAYGMIFFLYLAVPLAEGLIITRIGPALPLPYGNLLHIY